MGEQVNTGFELSPQQKSVWFAQQGRTYCSQCVLVLETAVDAKKLRSALGAVIARHEILRTTFPARPGVKLPFQLIHESLAAEWREAKTDAVGVMKLAEEERRNFDLANGPVVRACLANIAPQQPVLLLTVPTLCADASSLKNLASELLALYGGDGSALADAFQYADYAAWQAELGISEDEEAVRGQAFWKERGTPQAALRLPLALKEVEATEHEGSVRVEVDAQTRSQIRASASQLKVSPAAVTLA